MTPDPLQIDPPDDTGTDTFGRFRYQARLTIPFCLSCIRGDGVLSVVPEHIEDIAVQFDWGWRFVQIKSRNQNLGAWRLRDVLPPGRGLRSLLRAYRAVVGVEAKFVLMLEGWIDAGDPLEELTTTNQPRSLQARNAVAQAFNMEDAECAVFLDRLQVVRAPTREEAKAANLQYIGELEPSLTMATIRSIEEDLVDVISVAMSAEQLGSEWPQCILASPRDELAARIAAKRLTPERLDRFRQLLAPAMRRSLLSGAAMGSEPSQLARKMQAGNANEHLVRQAAMLRNNAVRREVELRTRDLFGLSERLEDVQNRLLASTSFLPALHQNDPNAAARIFQAARMEIQQHAAELDPHYLFDRDPLMLLGELCELSDECKMPWS